MGQHRELRLTCTAVSSPIAGKRKASEIVDDFENVDPLFFSKRSKGSDSNAFYPTKDVLKPASYVLKTTQSADPVSRPIATARSRTILQAKSPVSKLNTSIARPSTLSAPAGRSPTRGKRNGLLSSRRRAPGQFSRVDPPQFSLGAAAPFSLDAALKGTIPSYAARTSAKPASAPALAPTSAPDSSSESFSSLNEPEMKASWFFDIHEDTPEQEMTNLLQHSTCTLDISSDEESELKARRDRAEGRDKENIPPVDDVSQTSSRRSRRVSDDEMVIEKQRTALGEMNPAEYYAIGCDETSVVIIAGGDGDDEETLVGEETPAAAAAAAPTSPPQQPAPSTFEFAPEINLEPLADIKSVDELMAKDEPSSKAAVLEPIEGTGESFDLWESGSVKDESEVAPAAAA